MVELAATIWADGPSSMPQEPPKFLIRQWGAWVEGIINAITSNSGLAYVFKSTMESDLSPAVNSMAWVIGDPVAENNGVYKKLGASGTGSWLRISDLPFGFIIADDAGAGSPDAIQATTPIPVSSSALVWLEVADTNTGSPVTISFNGASPLTIKTNSGGDVAAGGLTAGMTVLGIASGSTFRLLSDQTSAGVLAAAEGFANAALAAANAGFVFNTETDFTSASIPAGLNFVRTAGYYAPGDGGGHLKQRISTPSPVEPWHKQSADGAWWAVAGGQDIHVEMFGAIGYTAEELMALNGGPAVDDAEAANDVAFADADAFRSAHGAGQVFAERGIYVKTVRYERTSGIYLEGAGVGECEPRYPQRPKTWEGTTLLYRNTGSRQVTFPGITSMKYGGGWKEDPENAGQYFKLWSAYDDDAAGTTPATIRQFSAAVLVKENVQYGGLRNLRICNWIGTDGISDWSNPAITSLGDEWDMGYVVRNGEYVDDFNVQVIGGWREADHALVVTTDIASRAERNHFRKCKFQGARTLIRAPDRWDVDATTSNSVQIYFSEENYWPATGSFRGSDNVTYSYTGKTKVGTALTFTGVNPDPSGIFQVRHPSAGFANTEYEDCMFYGLDHVSGDLAGDLGIIDSRAMEISGYPLRGVKFTNCKWQSGEKVLVHMHDCQDTLFDNPQFEGGGHMIASPQNTEAADPSNFWVPAAAQVGETRNLRMKADDGTVDQDRRLFRPRGGVIDSLQIGPVTELNGHLHLKPLRSGRDTTIENWTASSFVRAYDNGNVAVTAGGANRLTYNSSGNITPGADNTQAFGTSALRFAQFFAGTATIGTSDKRLKQQIGAIEDAILDAWGDVQWVGFKFNDAVADKGDAARLHFGLIAQQVQVAFATRGLNAFELGLLCYDEWDEQPAVYEPIHDPEGNEIGQRLLAEAVAAGNRYSLRYNECFAVEAAYQRRRLNRLEEAISL
ncbi:tail fiber domain-containing protein [Neorhizobium petrolearium]|uniref:Tail fiber domain-containing protein n=1 Tax=Neorhizobium petrolearium TaxID=515361 RepID=A0ABY8LZK6_9HYPH|nr:tail fiber domain-containing protein [Neorhizobium petrolearium]MCC2612632.1 tail fiber domain-containing protein [Neorhizobium petrolearium]WGI67755.1 tail fiber domain-containing protein [Neorhizobium petrolearium]